MISEQTIEACRDFAVKHANGRAGQFRVRTEDKLLIFRVNANGTSFYRCYMAILGEPVESMTMDTRFERSA